VSLILDTERHAIDMHHHVRSISDAKSRNDLHAACTKVARFLDASDFFFGLIWPNGVHSVDITSISNYSSFWTREYAEKSYHLVDPRISECMCSATPILWSTEKPYLSKLAKEPLAMMESARENRLGAGVLAFVRCHHGAMGFFGVGVSTDDNSDTRQTQLQRIAPYVSYFGGYVQQAVLELPGIGEINRRQTLTVREKDCLCWAAEGCTAAEIAARLFVTESTVKFHMRNVIRKMNARNTTQALALAIVNGYIEPTQEGRFTK
jgi:DNA-binding CsgD family transcriptional regulator